MWTVIRGMNTDRQEALKNYTEIREREGGFEDVNEDGG